MTLIVSNLCLMYFMNRINKDPIHLTRTTKYISCCFILLAASLHHEDTTNIYFIKFAGFSNLSTEKINKSSRLK